MFNCSCCKRDFPLLHRHIHHKIPKSLGGKDTRDNLAELCVTCHDTLHSVAYRLFSKKYSPSMTVDMLNSIYPDNKEAQKNCMELAIIVRDSMIQHKEKGLDPNHLVSISTTLYKKHKDFITTRIKELKLTQEEYIRSLILQDLGKRFGLNPYDEAASVKAAKKMKRIK